jgi:hypothetical protein
MEERLVTFPPPILEVEEVVQLVGAKPLANS